MRLAVGDASSRSVSVWQSARLLTYDRHYPSITSPMTVCRSEAKIRLVLCQLGLPQSQPDFTSVGRSANGHLHSATPDSRAAIIRAEGSDLLNSPLYRPLV